MAISLMSLLGGNVNLSAANGADEPGKVTLTSNGDAAFETIMAASELQEISAEQLAAFFSGQTNALSDAQKAEAQQLMKQLGAVQEGQKLPADLIVTLQEMLPEGMAEVIEQALSDDGAPEATAPKDVFGELFSKLPKRELTPEELSEIVQKTGIPPVVIFTVLQDTPAASPNLAANMVDDMGAAEKLGGYQASLPGLDLPAAAQADDAASQANGKQEPVKASMLSILNKIVDALNHGATPAAQTELPKGIAAKLQAAGLATEQPKGETGNVVDLTQMAATAKQDPAVATQHPAAAAAQAVQQDATDSDAVPTTSAASTSASVDSAGSTAATTAATQAPKDQAPVESKFMAQLSQHHRPVPPTDQVLVNVRQAVADGATRVEIKLNPSELGRVEVRIDTASDGQSQIHVTADRKDTLDMLQRDARALERALNEVGVKTDSNSLSFNLRGGDQQQHQQQAQNEQQDQNGRPSFASFTEGGEGEERANQSEMALTYDAGKIYRLNVDWGVDIRA